VVESKISQGADARGEMSRNSHGEWEFEEELGEYASVIIKDIAVFLVELDKGKVSEEGGSSAGVDFRNEIFAMRPYHWGNCTCGVGTGLHHESCAIRQPNFRFGNLELRWYHAIGPGMIANRPTSREEIRRIYLKSLDSILHLQWGE